MKISKYFNRSEIECKCNNNCGFDSMDTETLMIADLAREFVGEGITPSSGCRCPAHNASVGGAEKSQHVLARAMDLPCKDPQALFEYLDSKFPDKYGFGVYKTFVHVDSRTGGPARWVG